MAALLGGYRWVRSQISDLPVPTTDLSGQTIIITGANSGLGLEAARYVVQLNAAKVILAVRTLSNGEAAQQSIEESTGRKGVMEVWQLDLADYASVRSFARRAETLDRLDAVSENAAIYTYEFTLREGVESTITVNVLGTFLLALLLLPKLRETAVKFGVAPRLSLVSSFVHMLTTFPESKNDNIFAALNDKSKTDMNDRYNVSKLIEIYVVRELAALVTASSKKGDVIINTLNPGFCRSNIMREAKGAFKVYLAGLRSLLARSTEVGSRTLVAGIVAGPESHGEYMHDCVVGEVGVNVSDTKGQQLQKRVWQEASQQLESIQPGILQNI
ncbi:MAG: hypothetical protein M1825_003127 [Sarcosagium campestre]|nr:MAG: hypothetical protein M1825_003127 [Sarcosagium campestre]